MVGEGSPHRADRKRGRHRAGRRRPRPPRPEEAAARTPLRPARLARAPAAPGRPGHLASSGLALSAHEDRLTARPTAAQLVADFLATFAIVGGLVGLVYYPGRLATGAVFVALFAAALGDHRRPIIAVGVALTALCWFLGMTIAVLLDRPIF
ncbi:MAG TPA: hypothetical protein VFR63_12970 [Gaiellaceae bacterium]|nr:hypothetical protein [Gaiellaceae bacterium]